MKVIVTGRRFFCSAFLLIIFDAIFAEIQDDKSSKIGYEIFREGPGLSAGVEIEAFITSSNKIICHRDY
jgi:hypothetical protein